MPKSYIELVPRSAEELKKAIGDISIANLPCNGFNFPEIRAKKSVFLSPEEMMAMRTNGELAEEKEIALHLRTRDHSIEGTLQRIRQAAASNIQTVLLVTGDALERNTTSGTTHTHDFLNTLHSPPPGVSVAIGADIYHEGWGRWKDKIPAITRGIIRTIFTQPIFSQDTFEEMEQKTGGLLQREQIFAGITWVTDTKSRDYWQRVNKVPLSILPKGSANDTIRENSIAQAAGILRTAKREGYSTYTMVMKGTLEELQEIFQKAENIQEI